MATAWDAYARELVGMGYGFPLWDPEPEWHGEVLIGDVGFLVKGRFHRLFNPTLPAEHDVNQVWGVPDVFEELGIPGSLYSYKTTAISADTVCSKSFVKLDINANIKANSTVNLGLSFRCTNDQVAVLVLPTKKAIGEQLLPNSLIPKYMGRNHAYWYEFATERAQLDLKQEDIILISGWIKTARWAVAAFVEGGREVELSFGAEQASLADASFSVTTTQGVSRSWHQHSGPDTDEETTAGSSSVSRSIQDQCMFLHFYNGKRRLGGILPKLLPMKIAAAGEDGARRPGGGDPPEDDDDPEAPMILADSISIDEVPHRTENYDPCEPILGYILQNSDASIAVASTMDLPTVAGDGTSSGSVQQWLNSDHPRMYATGADGWQVGSLHNLDDGVDFSIDDAADIDDVPIENMMHEDDVTATATLSPSSQSRRRSTSAKLSGTPATVPCQYKTKKILGSGACAIVKEAVHLKTGKYYACKVINNELMEGREYMVRNEIAVLKKVSRGNPNIVTLHDYFETSHNVYLCFDLCTGGELFDRICAKGYYYEADAAELVRTIMGAVKYVHSCDIVHRDLKPENLLFRTKAENADIMITDFGISRVMDDHLLTDVCGTPGYMAPEIFKKTGHGKPVDIWAMGVITYFLLCGYMPFDRDTQPQEIEATLAADYKFEPEEYWQDVSQTARDFVTTCLTIDPAARPTAEEALQLPWLASATPHYVPKPESSHGGPKSLLPHVKKAFDAKKTVLRKAVLSMVAMRRMSPLALTHTPELQIGGESLRQLLEESEKEHIDGEHLVMHFGNSPSEEQADALLASVKRFTKQRWTRPW